MDKFIIGIKEGVIVLAAGLALAFVGNALYGSSGIDLSNDYFRKLERPPVTDEPKQLIPTPGVATDGPDDHAGHSHDGATGGDTKETPQEDSIAPATGYDDAKWFKDAKPGDYKSMMGLEYVPTGKSPSWHFNELTSPQAAAFHAGATDRGIVFVDARTPDHYAEGRIPGAVSLSHFHFKRDWPAVQARVSSAPALVIYCAGGDCDDSEGLATTLVKDVGFQQDRIFIYRGGMLDWRQSQRPIEGGK